jgi:hypothetical protein
LETSGVWSTGESGLSLHRTVSGADRDFFSINLPTPTLECGTVSLLGTGPGGYENTIVYSSSAAIRTIPRAGSVLLDEPLKVHNAEGHLSGRGSGELVVSCPQSAPVRRLCLSVGDRIPGEERTRFPNYDIFVYYQLYAQRISGRLKWFSDLLDDLAQTGQISPLPCPGGFFHSCPHITGAFELPHPPRPIPDCRADGPGCPMFYVFDWAKAGPLNVRFNAAEKFLFELRDPSTGKVMETATLVNKIDNSKDKVGDEMIWELAVPSLAPGTYILQVTGPQKSELAVYFESPL